MPSALLVSHNASMSGMSPHEPRKVARDAVHPARFHHEPAVSPADSGAAVPRKKGKHEKRSFDYIWRSGVAGGVAGCAVSNLAQQGAPVGLL